MSKSFTLSRDYAAPPERLFKAWTNLATLTRWFGCGENMLWTVHEWDVRSGGPIHVSLQFPNGPFVVHGEFLEVEALQQARLPLERRGTHRGRDRAARFGQPRGR